MDFTYRDYANLIELLKNKGYQFTNYKDYKSLNKPVILRHDIDNSLEKALTIAEIENENDVKSVFFVLLSTDFYNIFSKKSNEILREILNLGHEVGLHFDEKRYEIANQTELERYIECEKDILGGVLNISVDSVSMHRPSKWILENNLQFKNIINSYSKAFFHDFKYVSDSRMNWREDVLEIINSDKYRRLHILTHPFWYADVTGSAKERISTFIVSAKEERYYQLKDNIRDMDEILGE